MNLLSRLLWDRSFPFFRINGSGARDFLQGQTTQDFHDACAKDLYRTCWLTATGRLRALLEVRFDEIGAEVLVLSGDSEVVKQGFEQVIFPADDVKIQAFSPMRRLEAISLTQEKNSSPEIYWLLPDEALPEHLTFWKIANSIDVERWRILQGFPLLPSEINGETNPLELGLLDWVSLTKGCYLGQETMAKLARAGVLKQQLRYWHSDSPIHVGEKLVCPISSENSIKKAGLITSVLKLPDSGTSIGLALLPRQALEEPELFLAEDFRKVRISIPRGFVGLQTQN